MSGFGCRLSMGLLYFIAMIDENSWFPCLLFLHQLIDIITWQHTNTHTQCVFLSLSLFQSRGTWQTHLIFIYIYCFILLFNDSQFVRPRRNTNKKSAETKSKITTKEATAQTKLNDIYYKCRFFCFLIRS